MFFNIDSYLNSIELILQYNTISFVKVSKYKIIILDSDIDKIESLIFKCLTIPRIVIFLLFKLYKEDDRVVIEAR